MWQTWEVSSDTGICFASQSSLIASLTCKVNHKNKIIISKYKNSNSVLLAYKEGRLFNKGRLLERTVHPINIVHHSSGR